MFVLPTFWWESVNCRWLDLCELLVNYQFGFYFFFFFFFLSILLYFYLKSCIHLRWSLGCRFPGCIINLGVIPGYIAVTGWMASDLHPRTKILTNTETVVDLSEKGTSILKSKFKVYGKFLKGHPGQDWGNRGCGLRVILLVLSEQWYSCLYSLMCNWHLFFVFAAFFF